MLMCASITIEFSDYTRDGNVETVTMMKFYDLVLGDAICNAKMITKLLEYGANVHANNDEILKNLQNAFLIPI